MADPQKTHAAASKLAQLLGETIVHHTPWSSAISAQEKRRVVDDWLEGLEGHVSTVIGPLLSKILEDTNPPPEVRTIIEQVISPTAQFGSTIQQIALWGVLSSLFTALSGPYVQGVINDANASAVTAGISKPLPISIIATALGRGLNLGDQPTVTVEDWAVQNAWQSGVNKDELGLMASLVGLPPALQELFELYRRGDITLDEVRTGLREGDFRDDWIERTIGLAHAWLTPIDFVRAAVQSQMSYLDARNWANKTGLETSTELPLNAGDSEATPDMFGLAFSITGRPPGPQELARMALRGIIPWDGTGAGATTFQQGIAESDVKTKWTDALRALSQYFPPPREVGTLLSHGAITEAQAQQLWEASGVPAELARGYVYMTQQEHITQDKLQALGEIKTGYFDGIFSREQALQMLSDLGRRGKVATDILDILDFRRQISAIGRVVGRVETLYGTSKLSATDAKTALMKAGIEATEADKLLETWSALREAPFRVPTTYEIGAAVHYGTLTTEQALKEIQALGYQERDAAIVLSAHSHLKVTPLPPAGTTVTG